MAVVNTGTIAQREVEMYVQWPSLVTVSAILKASDAFAIQLQIRIVRLRQTSVCQFRHSGFGVIGNKRRPKKQTQSHPSGDRPGP